MVTTLLGGSLDVPWELLHEPEEDSGSETADRYEYQYQVVARHCCEFDSSDLQWILCEWHTDYVLALADGKYILVSVKHREHSQGTWTLAGLCGDGGLKTLRARWQECNRPHQARLATNGALNPEARKLATACGESNTARLKQFSEQLYQKLGCKDSDEAFEFLLHLRIEHELPSRKYIRAHNVEKYVRPMLRSRGTRLSSTKVYDAIVEVVRESARAVNNQASPWVFSQLHSLDEQLLRDVNVARRMVDRERVELCLSNVTPVDGPLLQTGQATEANLETRLTKKLRQGGIGQTAIQSAQRTRRSWASFEAQNSAPLPGSGDLVDDLTTRVLHEAGMVESELATDEGTYGREMLRELNRRLTSENLGISKSANVDRLHLLGLAFQLTDECHIWWSPEFDVENDGAA